MHAQIAERAAAIIFRGVESSPGGNSPSPDILNFRIINLSQLLAVHYLFHFLDSADPGILAGHQQLSGLLCLSQHFLCIAQRERKRLLTQYIGSSAERFYRKMFVCVVSRTHMHQIRLFLIQHFHGIRIDVFNPIGFCEMDQRVFTAVRHTCQLQAGL